MTIEQFNKIQSEIPDLVLTQRARELITKLCDTGGKSWSLRVPPDPEKDPDMVFGELARRVEENAGMTPISYFLETYEGNEIHVCAYREKDRSVEWEVRNGPFRMNKHDGFFHLSSSVEGNGFNCFRFDSPREAKQSYQLFHGYKVISKND